MSVLPDLKAQGESLAKDLDDYNRDIAQAIEALEAENETLKNQSQPKQPIRYGMTLPSNGDPTEIEGRLKNKLTGTRKFYTANEADLTKALTAIKNDGQAGRGCTVISFKAQDTWANMAAGKQDTWCNSAAGRLKEASETFDNDVYVTFNHEPENDSGISDAQRDNWRKMHEHLAPIFGGEKLFYGAILMGYHSMPGVASGEGNRWLLEKCIPENVDFVFFDYYEKRGRNKKGTTTEETNRTNFEQVFKVLNEFTKPRAMESGLAETGICARGFAAIPDWYTSILNMGQSYGSTVYLQFNSHQNDSQPGAVTGWTMDTKREQAYAVALGKVHEYNG